MGDHVQTLLTVAAYAGAALMIYQFGFCRGLREGHHFGRLVGQLEADQDHYQERERLREKISTYKEE